MGSDQISTSNGSGILDGVDPSETPVLRLVGSRVTLADRVYSQIRKALMSGQFLPGQTLTIDNLSSQLGVSHMPVREALRRLSAVEALEVAKNGSTRVPFVSIERLNDICANRLLLESHAVALAAQKIDSDAVARLQAIIEKHEECRRANEVYRMLELNQHLHFEIYAQAGSPILTQNIENLWLRHGPYMRLLTAELVKQVGPDSTLEVGPGHEMMINALSGRDPDAAAEALKTDILGPFDMLVDLCREHNEAEERRA
ncbi:MAG: GntR family transcriptional regulator [Stappiaceae bacterium]